MEISKTTTILIRHAESVPSRDLPESDWPLSKLGFEQATALADELPSTPIDRVYSSPYLRALDTVKPLAQNFGRPVEVRTDLRERKLCDGMRDDWMDLLERSWRDFAFSLPGCESGFECQQRVRRCLEDIARENEGLTVAVSSHGNAIGLFLNSVDSDFRYEQWRSMRNPDIFAIEWVRGIPRILALERNSNSNQARFKTGISGCSG